MLPAVSCLCATKDRRRFLPRAIEDFFAQDYEGELELLIYDDGDDVVADIVPSSRPGRTVRYERVEPQWLGAKRNAMTGAAQADLLALWDDDDHHGAQRIHRQVEALLAAPSTSICLLQPWLMLFVERQEVWQAVRGDADATMVFRRRAWELKPFGNTKPTGSGYAMLKRRNPHDIVRIAGELDYVAVRHGQHLTSDPRPAPPWWQPSPWTFDQVYQRCGVPTASM